MKDTHKVRLVYLRNVRVSFFLGSWGMNRSVNKQIAWIVKRFLDDLFVPCSSGSRELFVQRSYLFPMNPQKRHSFLIQMYLQCFHQRPFLKFTEKSYKFKFPLVMGTFETSFDVSHCACDLPNYRDLLVDSVHGELNRKFLHRSMKEILHCISF